MHNFIHVLMNVISPTNRNELIFQYKYMVGAYIDNIAVLAIVLPL